MKKYLVIADHGIGDLMISLQPIINLYYQTRKSEFGFTLLVKSKFESDILKNLLPNYDIETIYPKNRGLVSRLKQLISLKRNAKKVFFVHSSIGLRTYLAGLIFFPINVNIPSSISLNLGFYNLINTKKFMHKLEKYSAIAGLDKGFWEPIKIYENKEITKKKKKNIILCPGSTPEESHKRWPTKYFINLSKQLRSGFPQHDILVLGSSSDKECIEEICRSDKNLKSFVQLEAKEFISTIKESCVVISGCTGTAHVANQLKTETITIFGPTDFRVTGPKGIHAKNLSAEIDCGPCYTESNRLGCGKPICMDQIKPEIIYNEVKNLLKKNTEYDI